MNQNTIIGLFICLITALLSILISNYIGIELLNLEKSPISPIIIAIIFGLFVSNSVKNFQYYSDGYSFSIKYILKLGIIFLGIRLSISDILTYGSQGLFVIIPSIIISIITMIIGTIINSFLPSDINFVRKIANKK